MRNAFVTLFCSVALVGSIAAQNESRIRCVASNTTVIGPAHGQLRFTCTGFLGDQVLIFNGFGIPTVQGTIGQLRNHPNVRKTVLHSGGQTSLRFQFVNRPDLNQGQVYILRGNLLIDQDPIQLY
ncbi:MAG: hypothetical protein ACE37K_05480 [Planctomycetota bacterium]